MRLRGACVMVLLTVLIGRGAHAQRPDIVYPPGEQFSRNMKVQFHQPLVGASDIRIEQEMSRPYVYQSHGRPAGFHIINIKDPTRASILYSWEIEHPELHTGGAGGGMIFKTRGRNYYIQSVQFRPGTPDADVVAIVFDVTGLPDTMKIREVGRIRDTVYKGGSHESFTYKHSDGRPIFMTTVGTPPKYGRFANLYDLDRFIAGDPKFGLIGPVPIPEDTRPTYNTFIGYHDMYAAYDPARKQDKFYGAGWAGYFAYDITRPEEPKLVATITGVSGVDLAHTFMVDPTGRFAVTETETQYQPIRIFDLKPALDSNRNISRPIGAWSPNWKNLVHQVEIRWPYVFAAGYADGLHVFNMMDPANPYTVGFWDTFDRPSLDPMPGITVTPGNTFYTGTDAVYAGNFGVDIRNADGLIVASDMRTGTWGFRMDGFTGWNGRQWGMPNISSVQDWDNGPQGAPRPQRVSVGG